MPTLWDHARAGLIAAHVTAICVAAIPTPAHELTAATRSDPETHRALAPWAGVLVSVGLAQDNDHAIDWLFDAGRQLNRARNRVVKPLMPYFKLTGTRQGWRMFGTVPSRVGRLEIHGRSGDTWTPLYVDHGPAAWSADLLEHSRMRSLRGTFAQHKNRHDYRRFAAWIAKRGLDDHPDLDAVRVQVQGLIIDAPHRVRERGGLRPTDVFWPRIVERVPADQGAAAPGGP